MKFKEYLDKILDNVAFIEEFCNGRHIETHICFGFGNLDEINGEVFDETNNFFLYGTGDSFTSIDITQDIVIDGAGIVVKDTNDNILNLHFFSSARIPHPNMTEEVVDKSESGE